MNFLFVISVLVFEYFWIFLEATVCYPDSLFQVDCNSCICSNDGKKYSCETQDCTGENRYDDLYVEINKEGRVILRPKLKPRKFDPYDRDYALPKKMDIPSLFRKKNYDSDENSIESEKRIASDTSEQVKPFFVTDFKRNKISDSFDFIEDSVLLDKLN